MTESERILFDQQMMTIALRLAERGLGNVAPNPAVGAVLVDETSGEVIARGWTQPGGRPHAETEAIARAGPRARGATLYVTLEPCSHYGKTPPCAEAIIAAGVGRVVSAIEDPDPRVAGRGHAMLEAAGIPVTRHVMSGQADWVTRGHILRVSERRPFVIVKMAMSASGLIPRGSDGRPVWVTGPEARAHSHLLRAASDAILIGRGTLDDDDPELNCRLPGLLSRSPRPVVLAGRSLPGTTGRLIANARENHAWVFIAQSLHREKGLHREAGADADLVEAGCKVTSVTDVGGRVWLPAVMEALVAAGVTRLLVEGGPQIWQSFFEAGLVDAVAQYMAQDIGWGGTNAGPAPGPGTGSGKPAAIENAAAVLRTYAGRQMFKLIDHRQVGNDRLYLYRRIHGGGGTHDRRQV